LHTIHYFAVEADSTDEAVRKVATELGEGFIASWSDWYVIGGGRWNSDPDNQYTTADNDVIAYKVKPVEFQNCIEQIKIWQRTEIAKLIEQIDPDEITLNIKNALARAQDHLENKTSKSDTKQKEIFALGFQLFLLRQVQDLMNGNYCPDSHYFDITGETVLFEPLEQRLKTDPDKQYLVPVDFHF
jgi:hypothetical protein